MRSGGRNGASVLGHHRHQHLRAGHLCADAGFRALTPGNPDPCSRGRYGVRCRFRGTRQCRQPATFYCVSGFNIHAQACSDNPDEFGGCNAHGVRHRRGPYDPLAGMGHRDFTPGGPLVVEGVRADDHQFGCGLFLHVVLRHRLMLHGAAATTAFLRLRIVHRRARVCCTGAAGCTLTTGRSGRVATAATGTAASTPTTALRARCCD